MEEMPWCLYFIFDKMPCSILKCAELMWYKSKATLHSKTALPLSALIPQPSACALKYL